MEPERNCARNFATTPALLGPALAWRFPSVTNWFHRTRPPFAGTDGFSSNWPVSLGEPRKVAEQREMLRAAGISQVGANYPPEEKAESTGKLHRKVARESG